MKTPPGGTIIGDETNGRIDLPDGYSLYWKTNEVGGRTYLTDEVDGGVFVWDTAMVSQEMLLQVLALEDRLRRLERVKKHLARKGKGR